MQNKFYKFYLIGFYILLAIPLISLRPWFSPPEWGKTIVFRILFSVILFIFIYQLFYNKPENIFSINPKTLLDRKNPVFLPFWILILFLALNLFSVIFSISITNSLWESPTRSGGFVNFAGIILFFILLFLIIKKGSWKKVLNFAIIVGCIIALIGIISKFGIFSSIINPSPNEAYSTLGGPTFLGMFLLVLLFPALGLALSEKERGKKLFYSFSLIMLFGGILMASSQASFAGFAAGLLYFLFFYPRKTKKVKIVMISLLVALIALFGFAKAAPQSIINKIHIIDSMVNWHMDESRLSAWKVALRAIKSRPVLGYGFENFSIAFDKHYDPTLPVIGKPDQYSSWWDRAHNMPIEIAVTAGIPALLAYLSFILIILLKLYRYSKAKISESLTDSLISLGLGASMVAYFIDTLLSFNTFSTYLIFFFVIFYSMTLLVRQNSENETNI